jgi:hypothetical protein
LFRFINTTNKPWLAGQLFFSIAGSGLISQSTLLNGCGRDLDFAITAPAGQMAYHRPSDRSQSIAVPKHSLTQPREIGNFYFTVFTTHQVNQALIEGFFK